MAFNPFHRFRKHQKAFFAVMLIVCMITFIFSFGRGDFFQWALGKIRIRRAQGDLVTTLYKSKVYEDDLDHLARRRKLANQFMLSSVRLSHSRVMEDLQKQAFRNTSASFPPSILGAVQGYMIRNMQFGQFQQLTPQQRFERSQSDLRNVFRDLQLPSVEKNTEQVKLLELLTVILGFESWVWSPQRTSDDLYFGGSTRTEDLLDFMIWKRQADKLGIVLSEADVLRELDREDAAKESSSAKTFAEDPRVVAFIQPGRGTRTQDDAELLEALMDEFRVQLAQGALVGQESGVRAYRQQLDGIHYAPGVATPDEFLDFYRAQRTTLKLALLDLPVESFLSKVPGTPSESELETRYNKYKEQEQTPDRRESGFKEPRRIKIQYVSARPDSPFYKAQTEAFLKFLNNLRAAPILAPAQPFGIGGGPGAWATAVAFPLTFDPVIQEYETYKSDEDFQIFSKGIGVGLDLKDRKQWELATAMQMLAAGLSSTAPFSTPSAPFSIPAVALGVPTLYQTATLKAYGAAVLASASPDPLTGLALRLPFEITREPYEAVKPALMEKFKTKFARDLVEENLRTIGTELGKLKAKPEEAQQYIAKAIKEYGLQDYSRSKLSTQYEIADDPALKPFKEGFSEFAKSLRMPFQPDAPLPELSTILFAQPGVYAAQMMPVDRDGKKETFLFWHEVDQAAKVLPYEAVRGKVLESWRLEKARQLARQEADRIVKELKDQTWPTSSENRESKIQSFLTGLKQGPVFVLKNVAQQVHPEQEVQLGVRREYKPYRAPKDQIAYPPADLAKQFLGLQKEGDAMIVRDQPARHFYVAVLLDRAVPNLRDFMDVYVKTPDNDPLWDDLLAERSREYRENVLTQFRKDANPEGVDEEGKFIIPDNVRARFSGSTDSRE
jgi:hypothetical protein